MKKYLLILLSTIAFWPTQASAQIITGFGTSQTNPFNIGTYPSGDLLGNWGGTGSLTTTSASVTNASNDSSSNGIFATLTTPVAITGNTSQLTLTGTLNSATPGTNTFSITLYDSSFNTLVYQFNWSSFTGTNPVAVTASLVAPDASFNGTVSNWGLGLFGPGGDSPTTVSFTFDDLQSGAVPEPSTYALLTLGLGVLGFGFYRRQKNSSCV